MPRPLLYELNTRCWLRRLSDSAQRPVRLENVPESEFKSWKRTGVTHLWLMGVWTTGPRSRQAYLGLPETQPRLSSVLPDWTSDDVTASPYAISRYTVAADLGGDPGLATFRERLHEHDIQLILDFVPNHVGLDHPWLDHRPELFVQSPREAPGTFSAVAGSTERWIAHGKDPYFPPWIDTAQIDLRLESAQGAMIAELRQVAARCDGIRCDMAMLALKEIFEQNWRHLPALGPVATGEFWTRALAASRRDDFLFIAEAYWDLESRLLQLGFDYVYDKRVTDFILDDRWTELRSHLTERGSAFVQRSVHFLENHDEARAAGRLPLDGHRLGAFLTSTLPGMWLVHDGQLHGARLHAPVQLARLPIEPGDGEVTRLYDRLVLALNRAGIADGDGRLLDLPDVVAIHWKIDAERHVIALANGNRHPIDIHLDLSIADPTTARWNVQRLMTDDAVKRAEEPIYGARFPLRLEGRSFELIEFTPAK